MPENEVVTPKKKRTLLPVVIGLLLVFVLSVTACLFVCRCYYATDPAIRAFARENGLTVFAWPEDLQALLEKNPDTKDFVCNYPLLKEQETVVDLSQHVNSETVPLLFQWDTRWGYEMYAGEMMGLSGCGPTCLSMVCLYLLDDPTLTPKYIADYSVEKGYYHKGSGSTWTLISKGGVELGLNVQEIPLVEKKITRSLEAGNPVICVVGPGFFTTTGHFIVMTDYADGYVTVNDPNSPTRSAQTWKLTEVMEQIRNLWVCSLEEA